MERKMLNLGRAKKKLRYLQEEEKNSCPLKIKDVFTLKDIDNIFDDLESEVDTYTPQLSPIPISDELVEQLRGKRSPGLKSASPFGVEEPVVLAPENNPPEDLLSDRGSPFQEIAPIKTSSPLDLVPAGDVEGENTKRTETSPVLFCVEDEEPVQGVLIPSQNERPESPKALQEASEPLVSPPVRLEFAKPVAEHISLTSESEQPPTTSSQECQTTAPEPETKEESQIDESERLSPSILVPPKSPPNNPAQSSLINPPTSPPKEPPKNQVPQTKLDVESSFQKKLSNAFQRKTAPTQEAQKQDARKQAARAPSPVELDDDFMILEDDAPILFTFAKKTNAQKEKRSAEGVHAKNDSSAVSSVGSASSKLGKGENKFGAKPDATKAKKTKAKRVRAQNMGDNYTAAQKTVKEIEVPLTEVDALVEACEPCSVPEASQETDLPGKQTTKSKTSRPDKLGKKDGKYANYPTKPFEKPVSKMKNPGTTNDGKEKSTTNVKKKNKKVKSTSKDVPESEALGSANQNKQGNDHPSSANEQVPEEQEQVEDFHNNTDPPPEPAVPPNTQSNMAEDKKANKLPVTENGTSKRKKLERTEKSLKTKELPAAELDVSAEGPVSGRRKRKPPREWWLANSNQNEDGTQEQEMTVQESLQKLKFNKKAKRKEAPSVVSQISAMSPEEQESQTETNKNVAVKKMPKKVEKLKSTVKQKSPKKAGGRRKPKSAARNQHEKPSKTSGPVLEEEEATHADVEKLNPVVCSPPPRRQSLTPAKGEKRVFDKIYTRDSQSESAQKRPAAALCQQGSLPEKRQRKPTSNWWEVPQSQEPAKSSRLPLNCSPSKSRSHMAPPRSAVEKAADVITKKAQKMVHVQKQDKVNIIQTPKSIKRSLTTFDAVLASGKPGSMTAKGLESRQKGRRNLLNSLEDQSELSSENIHGDQQEGSSHATFDVCTSGVTMEPLALTKKVGATLSAGSNRVSDYGLEFKSGPSSMIELERYEEHQDSDLPSSRMIPHLQHRPRVLSNCDLCGPPLQPIILEAEDWDNLSVWFAHLWPSTKDDQVFSVISPDDFHWHAYAGRAMGHMVDLQNSTFSNGKILLGSYMKKPSLVEPHAFTVFNLLSSCVRVEIDGVKMVYNSGQTFMVPSGKSYSIHNVCQEPAVLWYHRMLNHTRN